MQELQSMTADFPSPMGKWRGARAIKLRKVAELR
jgi:hypothetical protein